MLNGMLTVPVMLQCGGWPTRGGEAHHGRDQPRSCTEAQSWSCWLRMRAQLVRRDGKVISVISHLLS